MNRIRLIIPEEVLEKSRDEVIHIVSAPNVGRGSRIAFCGFDTTGRTFKPENTANCVVCLAMSEQSKHDKEQWLREYDEYLDTLHE